MNIAEQFGKKISSGGTLGTTVRDSNKTSTLIHIEIPFESFRIFGFIDDTGFRTTAPGIGARRRYGFNDDVQRSFYSGYFAGHGLKVQAVTFPNGMIGSIYIGSWRVSDSGLLNLSGLDQCLTTMFHEEGVMIGGDIPTLPVLYGDGVFPCLNNFAKI